MPGLTVQSIYQSLKRRLAGVAVSSGQSTAEARILMAHVFNLSTETLWAQPEQEVLPDQLEALEALLTQRLEARVPIQYLVGTAHFYGLAFKVTPAVLIPRPETELLVESALQWLNDHSEASRVLDIGTGSGAIALTIARFSRASVQVVATDTEPEALAVARENALHLGIDPERIQFLQGSLFEPVASMRFDCILSNPPYIDPALRPTLMPEVREHEPASALFAPEEGYAFYKALAYSTPHHLKSGGRVLVETGLGMASRVCEMFSAQGFRSVSCLQDLNGVERHVLAAAWEPYSS